MMIKAFFLVATLIWNDPYTGELVVKGVKLRYAEGQTFCEEVRKQLMLVWPAENPTGMIHAVCVPERN